MKFGILSDMHMDFSRSKDWDFTPEEGVFYLCAGDINSKLHMRQDFVNRHKDHMLYVLGNHDYYGFDFPTKTMPKEAVVGGLKIVGVTLWTDLSNPKDWFNYVNGLVDSRYIDGLTYDAYTERFAEDLEYLMTSEADVIVTHHCPTLRAIAPQFQVGEATKYNPGFASDLENTILSMAKPPKLWVYGHTHWRHSYRIGETLFVCNPMGYPGENTYYTNYEPQVIEID